MMKTSKRKGYVKKWIYKKVIGLINPTKLITFISLIIGVLLLRYRQATVSESDFDWVTNGINTCFSVFLTLSIVQLALDDHSKRINKNNENRIIIKNYISISSYFRMYASHYNQLVIPQGEEGHLNNQQLENDFVFSDMKDLFNCSSDSRDSLKTTVVESFLKSELLMREKLNDLLISNNFEHNKRLAQLINDFIRVSIEYDTRDGIIDVLNNPEERQRIITGISDEKMEWIKDGDEGKLNCCSMYFFYKLYWLLKKEAVILGGIMEIINSIHSTIIGVEENQDFVCSHLEQPYRHCVNCETYTEEKIDRCPNCHHRMI